MPTYQSLRDITERMGVDLEMATPAILFGILRAEQEALNEAWNAYRRWSSERFPSEPRRESAAMPSMTVRATRCKS